MSRKKINLLGHDFDNTEDEYDRLKNLSRNKNEHKVFTNKANFKKIEFDYEEDPYEPEKGS